MAARIRRSTLAAITLPLLFLAMSAIAQAATITVDTLSPTSVSGHCNLSDAINAANTKAVVQGCTAGTGTDTIDFSLSGTITLSSELPAITNTSPNSLTINGSGQSITVDGAHSFQIFSVNSGATLNLQFLTIEDGSVTSILAEGGGISNQGTLTVANSTLSGNHAIGEGIGGVCFGGAIFNDVGATLTVTDSTFSANQATASGTGSLGNGGAISNDSGTVTVANSTFSVNQATSSGGAIVSVGTLTITNSTFSANQARFAGAIYNASGTVNLKGSILADSTANNCNGTFNASYSIADDDTCFTNGTNNNVVESSTSAVGLDPAGLAMNGGPTETIALQPNSPAVDFIPVADCTDQSMTPVRLTTDQRGLPRPDPGNPLFCDAGAYELQTTPFVLAPNSERLQIARSTTPNSDQVNLAFTFTENGFPACDSGDNAFNGFTVLLRSGRCEALDDASLELMLAPGVVHTVNHQSYGTIFQSIPPETVSARMVALPTPASPVCGEWTVNIEVAGIDSSGLGNGPFALVLSNPDGDTGCFDITNAIVGNQIPTPGHGVRRGVRR